MGFDPTDLVPFGKGFALPKKFSAAISTKDLPYRVEVEVVLEGHRFICEELQARRKKGGPPVTSEGIRRLPMRDLIRTAALGNVFRVRDNPHASGGVVITPVQHLSFRRFAKDGPTDEALEHVALAYRLAYACNDSPTKAVEDAFRLPRSTAERWVSRARDLELIDIPDPRRRT